MLRQAELQPHRCRYWKTPALDDAFVRRASAILWCYEQIARLAEREEIVLCWDEKPNLQALERTPGEPMQAGRIERQEFENTRHGTVNFAVAMAVHDGTMQGWCLDKNDSAHLCPALAQLFGKLKGARKIHLIWDWRPQPYQRLHPPVFAGLSGLGACASHPGARQLAQSRGVAVAGLCRTLSPARKLAQPQATDQSLE